MRTRIALLALLTGILPTLARGQEARPQGTQDAHCAPDNGGITLSKGFCATVFADSLAGPRHLVVAPNGDVFVALQSGGVMALRDHDGDGIADERNKFGDGHATEVVLFDGYLYTENGSDILRYRLAAGSLAPTGEVEQVVTGLPTGGHGAKTFTIARDGALYVNIGSRTNACQREDRKLEVPGVDPCTELETRAGIWRFDARKLHQTQSQAEHFARGIRNAVGITINPHDGDLWVTQHGRDQLGGGGADWPKLFNAEQGAELPAEELFHVQRGDDFGWPYCYFDPEQKTKVLAPEYGGDGKQVGRCSTKKGDVAYFPAHWAPNALLFYTGSMFPARYREGAFIAFHGSWNRAPLPQAGYKVVFQPMRNGRADGAFEIFADGFAPNLNVARSTGASGNHRPSGLAQGTDGALYITDDAMGRIWKVVKN
ncbi:MAG TPA: PQQ-dependent sugar dehydrogenase [Gemmatimonadaceae bacterium]|jgi:glucose/arabinose dehydrogenase